MSFMSSNRFSKQKIYVLSFIIGFICLTILSVTIVTVFPQHWSFSRFFRTICSTRIDNQLKQGQFLQAYQKAESCNKWFSKTPESYYYLGKTLFYIGNYQDSMVKLQLALRLKELPSIEQGDIYYMIGIDYSRIGDNNSALAYLETALQLDPLNHLTLDALGQQYLKIGNYSDALNTFHKELASITQPTSNPLAVYAYYYLAKTYFKTSDYNLAKVNIDLAEGLAAKMSGYKPPLFLQHIEDLKQSIGAHSVPSR